MKKLFFIFAIVLASNSLFAGVYSETHTLIFSVDSVSEYGPWTNCPTYVKGTQVQVQASFECQSDIDYNVQGFMVIYDGLQHYETTLGAMMYDRGVFVSSSTVTLAIGDYIHYQAYASRYHLATGRIDVQHWINVTY